MGWVGLATAVCSNAACMWLVRPWLMTVGSHSGNLTQRAQRLFAVKGLDPEDYPSKLVANKSKKK